MADVLLLSALLLLFTSIHPYPKTGWCINSGPLAGTIAGSIVLLAGLCCLLFFFCAKKPEEHGTGVAMVSIQVGLSVFLRVHDLGLGFLRWAVLGWRRPWL